MTVSRGLLYGLFALLLSPVAAMAQSSTLPTPAVAVIDVQAVLRDAKAPQGVIAHRNKLDAQYQQEFASEEKKLADEDQELGRQRSVLSPEAFQEKVKAFQAKANDLRLRGQTRKRNLDRAYTIAMAQVQEGIQKAISEIATEVGANLVLPRSQVEFFDPRMDLTVRVVERTNALVKSAVFPDPMKDLEPAAKASAKESKKEAPKKDEKKK